MNWTTSLEWSEVVKLEDGELFELSDGSPYRWDDTVLREAFDFLDEFGVAIPNDTQSHAEVILLAAESGWQSLAGKLTLQDPRISDLALPPEDDVDANDNEEGRRLDWKNVSEPAELLPSSVQHGSLAELDDSE